MYELFDHTADLGLRVTAADLDELFAEAARGLISMIVEEPASIRAVETVSLRIDGHDPEYLLFDWLDELLALFETRRLLPCRFDVRVTDDGLDATVGAEPLDETRHRLVHEVKAITYHGLTVRRHEGGWLAEVIVDI